MDLERIKTAIDNSGISMTNLSKMTGIGLSTLYNRLKGIGEFTVSEIISMSKAMRLTDDERDNIFFGQ